MPKIMQALFILDVIALVYLLIRTPWLLKTREKYHRKVYSMMVSQKGEPQTQAEMDALSPYLSVYYDAIWGIVPSLFCFWKWNLGRMVKDQKKFDEVMNFVKKEG